MDEFLNESRRDLDKKKKKVTDQFGFIVNIDNKGKVRDEDSVENPGGASTPGGSIKPKRSRNVKTSRKELRLRVRREKKWSNMLEKWDDVIKTRPKMKTMRKRVRKGIPNSHRGPAWVRLAKVDKMINITHVGVYQQLVNKSCMISDDDVDAGLAPYPEQGVNVDNCIVRETIERDLTRTYPRHSMFYDSLSDSDDDDDEVTDASFDKVSTESSISQYSDGDVNGEMDENSPLKSQKEGTDPFDDTSEGNIQDQCWAKGMQVIEQAASGCRRAPAIFSENKEEAFSAMGTAKSEITPIHTNGVNGNDNGHGHDKSESLSTPTNYPRPPRQPRSSSQKQDDFMHADSGQAKLRRVLRAYSLYDQDVGYCQGMNFLAGMFIIHVEEEEAFWLLVAVMNDKPCRMRGLFGEGMLEAHQVLYIAEKLISQFHPKLAKHFDKEKIHITMFATQWLLTIFTSSFPFNVVTRIWDCFLSEGWKVPYRIMLAILEKETPRLAKMQFEDILNHFKDLAYGLDSNDLLESAFKIPLKHRHIAKYAKEWEEKQQSR